MLHEKNESALEENTGYKPLVQKLLTLATAWKRILD